MRPADQYLVWLPLPGCRYGGMRRRNKQQLAVSSRIIFLSLFDGWHFLTLAKDGKRKIVN